MSYQFKIKVFVGHRPVGWLKVGLKQTSIVLGLRSASKFESTTPSVFGAAMAELELPNESTPCPTVPALANVVAGLVKVGFVPKVIKT